MIIDCNLYISNVSVYDHMCQHCGQRNYNIINGILICEIKYTRIYVSYIQTQLISRRIGRIHVPFTHQVMLLKVYIYSKKVKNNAFCTDNV